MVTAIELRLHEVGRYVLSGQIIYPFERRASFCGSSGSWISKLRAPKRSFADSPVSIRLAWFRTLTDEIARCAHVTTETGGARCDGTAVFLRG